MLSHRRYEYLLAVAVPAAVLSAVFAAHGLYPFGDTSVAVWDQDVQYVGFYAWLSGVLHGEGSLFYSLSQGLGEGTAALFAYYLASPFSLMAAFSSPDDAPKLLSVMTLAKLPFAGLTCYAFLRRAIGAGTMHVALATAYALCGYAIVECSNIMWMDGVIMLPLVALGTLLAARGGKLWPLFASVACAVVFNWYTGYMCCLFSACFFLACCGADEGMRARTFLRRGLRYAAAMLLGVGASMALFLPSTLGILSGANTDAVGAAGFWPPTSVSELIGGFRITFSASDAFQPAVYLAAGVCVLALAFFLNREVPTRARLSLGVLAAFVCAAFLVGPIDVLFSGGKRATSFLFRYAFLLDFLLVALAACGYRSLFALPARRRRFVIAGAAGAFSALIALAALDATFYQGAFPGSPSTMVLQMALIAAFAILIEARVAAEGRGGLGAPSSKARRRRRQVAGAAMASILALTAASHGVQAYAAFSHCTRPVDAWPTYTETMREALSPALDDASSRGSVARVGVADASYLGTGSAFGSTPESFSLGYSSMSEYTSTMGGAAVRTMSALGYSPDSSVFGHYYVTPMLVADSLLSVGYIVDDEAPAGGSAVESAPFPFEGYGLYRNDYACPPAYSIAGSGLVDFGSDPFSNQEAMLSDASGQDAGGVYVEAACADAPGNVPGSASRAWDLTVEQSGALYAQFPALNAHDGFPLCSISVDGEQVGIVGGTFHGSVMLLGHFEKGDTVRVEVAAMGAADGPKAATSLWPDEASGIPAILAASFDEREFERIRSLVSDGDVTTIEMRDGYVALETSMAAGRIVLVTVPAADGWQAFVDGKPVDVVQCYGGLIGIAVPEGEHDVELRYETPGLAAGCALSAASIAAFAVWRVLAARADARRRKG